MNLLDDLVHPPVGREFSGEPGLDDVDSEVHLRATL